MLARPHPLGEAATARWTGLSLCALWCLAAYAALFHRLGDLPIYVWDEARDAANALEMLRTGDLLVTRYQGEPDLWNTKPPAAIWLLALSMKIFGVSEGALRLPSALAAAGTGIVIFAFVRHVTGNRFAALIGTLILFGTAGFVGPHVARTADYDAPLACCVTTALYCYFRAIEPSESAGFSTRWWWGFTAFLTCAVLVKGVAGLLIAPGLFAYAAMRGRLPDLARRPWAWIGGLAFLMICAGYYLAREAAGPGYLAAVMANELGGRFAGVIENQGRPWHYYPKELTAPWPLWFRWPVPGAQVWGTAFPWSWIAPIAAVPAFLSPARSVRRAVLLCVAAGVGYLLVISAAATKLTWYLAIVHPLIAIIVALGLHEALARLGRLGTAWPLLVAKASAIGLAALCIAGVVYKNVREINASPILPERMTQSFIRHVLARHPGLDHVRIVHDGHGLQGTAPYTAPEQFYVIAHRRNGRDIAVIGSGYRPLPGETLLWCAPSVHRPIRAVGEIVETRGECRAVRVPI